MKNLLTFILLIISAFGFGQSKTDSTIIDHYKTSKFDCAIFPENSFALLPGKTRFTPTRQEIDNAESALQNQLKILNTKRPNQGSSPIIDENLQKYFRQYFGYIDENGNKILFINCLWHKENKVNDGWLRDRIIVLDGGSYYWNVKFNLNAKKLFELDVNGEA